MARGDHSRREVLALALIFFFALLAWGMSMWTLKTRLSGPLLTMVQDEARQKALAPWIARAKAGGISYELAVSSPAAVQGKAVLWKVLLQADGTALEGGRRERPLRWSDPKALKADSAVTQSGLFWAIGVVEKGGPEPRLRYLGAHLAD